jgi:hypothetical protein
MSWSAREGGLDGRLCGHRRMDAATVIAARVIAAFQPPNRHLRGPAGRSEMLEGLTWRVLVASHRRVMRVYHHRVESQSLTKSHTDPNRLCSCQLQQTCT